MSGNTVIYLLRDPNTGVVRYVGKTRQQLKIRLAAHVRRSKEKKTHRDCWIVGLVAGGLRPLAEVIEVAGADWSAREIFWIAYYRACGCELTNQTAGGEGFDSETATASWSPERRRQQSLITAEQNRRSRGIPWSDERRQQQSLNQKRRWSHPQRRADMALTMTRIASSREYRSSMAASVSRAWTPERRARQAEVAKRVNEKRWSAR